MNHRGVRYTTATGALVASVVASVPGGPETLCLPGESFLPVEDGHNAMAYPERWQAVDGALVALPVLTLTPSAAVFTANGVDECSITAAGATGPVDLLVEPGGTYTLDVDEPLVITSDVPATFTIRLVTPGYVCTPLTVRAE